ncbi:hypothetical protein L208DRAFT_1377289 [Tricholoma matsutake]|nr:hypothetical protein L208DRAFT_1377289 [Tricholoma matsutake 945]
MAKWLNNVGKTMGEVYGHSASCYWWHGSCNLPSSGAPINWKPDLVLLSREHYEILEKTLQCVNWLCICSFAEVTTEPRVAARMIPTVNGKSYLSFILQFDHHFATSLSFIGSGEYSLTVMDFQGQICYTSSLKSGLEPAQHFLTILAFFMFGNNTNIGLDSHFIHNPNTDQLVAVIVDDKHFELKEHIYMVESLVMMGHDEINLLVPTFIAGAHQYLCNILLYHPDENKEATGMLVDFDFAKTINNINDSKSGGKLVNDRLPSTSSNTEVRVPDINTESATRPKMHIWIIFMSCRLCTFVLLILQCATLAKGMQKCIICIPDNPF